MFQSWMTAPFSSHNRFVGALPILHSSWNLKLVMDNAAYQQSEDHMAAVRLA